MRLNCPAVGDLFPTVEIQGLAHTHPWSHIEGLAHPILGVWGKIGQSRGDRAVMPDLWLTSQEGQSSVARGRPNKGVVRFLCNSVAVRVHRYFPFGFSFSGRSPCEVLWASRFIQTFYPQTLHPRFYNPPFFLVPLFFFQHCIWAGIAGCS